MSELAAPMPAESSGERLHEPKRLLVAVAELVGAGLAVWGALACWSAAIGTLTVRLDDGTVLVSRTYEGNLVGLAVTLTTVAALLVVDAARQSVLGLRPRRRQGTRPLPGEDC
ncbi:hypothetical protein SacmaDRAFT_0540 [Saccharomonospora marina XMU15]|uniref:Uncharacterized protein n=1 Tax=Saccharomonospora marina XMU15 TaxID=882083 RepID=H5X498_9PSEU|nr:hypothetical protein [Saccharomonospora marina]EHR48841.1 hypothetical protein SacmaDRAFT_0540 [Saccharomonospora marina XMU15]